jgi:hypothetical protein
MDWKNKEEVKQYQKQYQHNYNERNKKQIAERHKKWHKINSENYKEKYKKVIKINHKKLFDICLSHYGQKCSKCSRIEELCIDHINGQNNGKYLKGTNLWRWLIKNNFPSEFRTLCRICNIIDGYLRKAQYSNNLKGIDDLFNLLAKGGK